MSRAFPVSAPPAADYGAQLTEALRRARTVSPGFSNLPSSSEHAESAGDYLIDHLPFSRPMHGENPRDVWERESAEASRYALAVSSGLINPPPAPQLTASELQTLLQAFTQREETMPVTATRAGELSWPAMVNRFRDLSIPRIPAAHPVATYTNYIESVRALAVTACGDVGEAGVLEMPRESIFQPHVMFAERNLREPVELQPPAGSVAALLFDMFVGAQTTALLFLFECVIAESEMAAVCLAANSMYASACTSFTRYFRPAAAVPATPEQIVTTVQHLQEMLYADYTQLGGSEHTTDDWWRLMHWVRLQRLLTDAKAHTEAVFGGDKRKSAMLCELDSLVTDIMHCAGIRSTPQRICPRYVIDMYRRAEDICTAICERNDFTGVGGPQVTAEEARRRRTLADLEQQLARLRSAPDDAALAGLQADIAHVRDAAAVQAAAQATAQQFVRHKRRVVYGL